MSEAAYIVHARSVYPNDLPQYKSQFKVTCPEAVTKTDKEYLWVVNDTDKALCDMIKSLSKTKQYFSDYLDMY